MKCILCIVFIYAVYPLLLCVQNFVTLKPIIPIGHIEMYDEQPEELASDEVEIEAIGIEVTSQPIELYKIFKIANLVNGGGEAKHIISEGYVAVNGEIETRKRRKMYDGDLVEFNQEYYVILCVEDQQHVDDELPEVFEHDLVDEEYQLSDHERQAFEHDATPLEHDEEVTVEQSDSAKQDQPQQDQPEQAPKSGKGRKSIQFF